jgi:hypothetical protein
MTKIEEETKRNGPNPLKGLLSKDVKDVKAVIEPKKQEKVFTPLPEFQQPSKLKDIFTGPKTTKMVIQVPKKKTKGLMSSNKDKYNEQFPEL